MRSNCILVFTSDEDKIMGIVLDAGAQDMQTEEELKNILVMPDDFYGGKDPVVHYIRTEKIVGDKGRELKMIS